MRHPAEMSAIPRPMRRCEVTRELLAWKIADALFTNGMKEKATRLVLELPSKRDGGGWSKQAAIDQIARVLARCSKAKRSARPKR